MRCPECGRVMAETETKMFCKGCKTDIPRMVGAGLTQRPVEVKKVLPKKRILKEVSNG